MPDAHKRGWPCVAAALTCLPLALALMLDAGFLDIANEPLAYRFFYSERILDGDFVVVGVGYLASLLHHVVYADRLLRSSERRDVATPTRAIRPAHQWGTGRTRRHADLRAGERAEGRDRVLLAPSAVVPLYATRGLGSITRHGRLHLREHHSPWRRYRCCSSPSGAIELDAPRGLACGVRWARDCQQADDDSRRLPAGSARPGRGEAVAVRSSPAPSPLARQWWRLSWRSTLRPTWATRPPWRGSEDLGRFRDQPRAGACVLARDPRGSWRAAQLFAAFAVAALARTPGP
jgi:hypothetical protein